MHEWGRQGRGGHMERGRHGWEVAGDDREGMTRVGHGQREREQDMLGEEKKVEAGVRCSTL